MSGINESVIFGGQSIPSSLQLLSKVMPEVSDALLRTLLKLVFDVITNKPYSPKALDKIARRGNVESVEQLFGGLLILVQTIVRLKPDIVKETDLRTCLKSLKFTEDCSNEFINAFLENKSQLYVRRSQGCSTSYYLKLAKLDWRIDITVSSSFLSKSFGTVIILQMSFSNGEKRSFEVSLSKFHIIRLYVASLLREFQSVEKMSALKVY